MRAKQPTKAEMEPREGSALSEETACDVCGRFGAYEFDDRHLCLDCYENAGSCCLEFGGDDLWKEVVGEP